MGSHKLSIVNDIRKDCEWGVCKCGHFWCCHEFDNYGSNCEHCNDCNEYVETKPQIV